MKNLQVFDNSAEEMSREIILNTSKRGTIRATYSQLVEVLGNPTLIYDDPEYDKSHVEWRGTLEDENGNKSAWTIYDWKEDVDPQEVPESMIEWSVGAHDKFTAMDVEKEIDSEIAKGDGKNASVRASQYDEDTDGWDDSIGEEQIFEDLENLIYELRNARRGIYTNAETYEQLGLYINELGERLSAFGMEIYKNADEDDASASLKAQKQTNAEAEDYSKKTKQGFEVVKIGKNKYGETIAILKRSRDYAVAWLYNTNDGTWGQGHYNFSTLESAEEWVKEEYGEGVFKNSVTSSASNVKKNANYSVDVTGEKWIDIEELNKYMDVAEQEFGLKTEPNEYNGYTISGPKEKIMEYFLKYFSQEEAEAIVESRNFHIFDD